ncbi:MAG: SOS response-associated peptidase [Ferruginibacter sp.]
MCFHFSLTQSRAVLEKTFQVVWDGPSWEPVYHADGFSFLSMPVITQEQPSRIQPVHWGLIPEWIKTATEAEAIRAKTLNARSETVFEKPSFRKSAQHFRCLVPATGFFEWMLFNKKKYPHYIYLKEHSLFCFAGLYAHWTDRQTGEVVTTFSILTTEANPLLARIHNQKQRMPVIIPADRCHEWLSSSLSVNQISSFLTPFSSEHMAAHPISRRITERGVDSNGPALIEPHHYPELSLLF